jgi:aminoglycoside 2'-N-acetyltransferase I
MVTPTAFLTESELAEIRALADAAFDEFTDADWNHCLGGLHAVVRVDGRIVAHGAVVQRRLYLGDRTLRCGYVEAIAVHADHRRQGLGHRIMEALEEHAKAYEVMALAASEVGALLYTSRGWTLWRGPSSTLGPDGARPTPEDDGSIHVLGGTDLDLDAPITCDLRDGDQW